jgi:hypothetical protein
MADIPSFQAEFTQAIQNFPPPLPPPGLPWNTFSVPLIGSKQTLVRVYLGTRTTRDPSLGRRTFDGKLHVLGPSGFEVLSSMNGPIRARHLTYRGDLAATLNFMIPARLCTGRLDGMFVLEDSFSPDGAAFLIRREFDDVPPVPLQCVLVRYDGPDYFGQRVDKQAGGLEMLASLDYLLRCMPFSGFTLEGCDFLHWKPSEPADLPSDQVVERSWHDLYGRLVEMRAASDTSAVYLGMLPTEASCAGTCGLGGGGVALFRSAETENAAHEFGHAIGRPHAPCDAVPAPGQDESYPDFFGRPRGSIGEFGVDLKSLTVFHPLTTFDFMTYCGPRWTSAHNYLLDLASLRSLSPPSGAPAASASRIGREHQFLSLRVQMTLQGAEVEIRNCFSVLREPPRAARCSYVELELVDRGGRILARVPGELQAACGARTEHADYTFWFPSRADARRLRIRKGETVLCEHAIGERAPIIRTFASRPVEERGKRIHLSWECEPAGEHAELLYSVRFSVDGKSWRCLVTGLRETSFVVDTANLQGGESCQLQLLATSAFRTSEKRIQGIAIERKPVRAFISEPKPGAVYRTDEPLYLCGAGFAPGRGLSRSDDVYWTTPSLGCIGSGYQVTRKGLAPGSHLITLHAPDGEGGEACASVRIEVRGAAPCSPDQDREDSLLLRARELRATLHEESVPEAPPPAYLLPAWNPPGRGGQPPCGCGGGSGHSTNRPCS